MVSLLVILTILTLNLMVIFAIKSRVNMIIFINTSNLITILLYTISIDNFLAIKGLAITTMIYSITISFLIVSNKDNCSKLIYKSKKSLIIFIPLTIICALSSLYVVKNIKSNIIVSKEKEVHNTLLKKQPKTQQTNKKFEYVNNKVTKDNKIFARFGDFIIILCTIITLIFLGIKHQKE